MMTEEPTFLPASAYSLDALGDIFTRSFEEYFYPGTTTAATLAARVRTEQIDLHRSLVLGLGDAPAGIALLGLRGDRAWCGGFGVMLPFRGRGLAHNLAAAMLEQARQAGARMCMLEVLTRNERALKTYIRSGFQPRRDLQILEWRRANVHEEPRTGTRRVNQEPRTENREPSPAHPLTLSDVAPARLLAHFAALHPAPAAWQRDLPALLVRGGMQGLVLNEAQRPRAYALITPISDGGARIEDLGADGAESAGALIGLLQARYRRLNSVNEPADSPLTPAFAAAGFAEVDRQHELWIDLQP
jgi:GNAT superfamily N-acetyltransferase